jgi:hypothetical protein
MNVEIGTEAAQFLEKEHINGIFVAVQDLLMHTERQRKMPQEDMNLVLIYECETAKFYYLYC